MWNPRGRGAPDCRARPLRFLRRRDLRLDHRRRGDRRLPPGEARPEGRRTLAPRNDDRLLARPHLVRVPRGADPRPNPVQLPAHRPRSPAPSGRSSSRGSPRPSSCCSAGPACSSENIAEDIAIAICIVQLFALGSLPRVAGKQELAGSASLAGLTNGDPRARARRARDHVVVSPLGSRRGRRHRLRPRRRLAPGRHLGPRDLRRGARGQADRFVPRAREGGATPRPQAGAAAGDEDHGRARRRRASSSSTTPATSSAGSGRSCAGSRCEARSSSSAPGSTHSPVRFSPRPGRANAAASRSGNCSGRVSRRGSARQRSQNGGSMPLFGRDSSDTTATWEPQAADGRLAQTAGAARAASSPPTSRSPNTSCSARPASSRSASSSARRSTTSVSSRASGARTRSSRC